MAIGTIHIDELTVHCVIGIIESERQRDQRIFIDAELDADFAAAAASDHIWDTINAPNLERNIAPTRSRATIILRKGRDHAVQSVHMRKL
jgi:dihydroneopterin aldolase